MLIVSLKHLGERDFQAGGRIREIESCWEAFQFSEKKTDAFTRARCLIGFPSPKEMVFIRCQGVVKREWW